MGFDLGTVSGLANVLGDVWEIGGERVSVSDLLLGEVEVLATYEYGANMDEYGLIRLDNGVLIFRYLVVRVQDGRKHVIVEYREVLVEGLLRMYASCPLFGGDIGVGNGMYYVRTSGEDVDNLELDWVVDVVAGESEVVVYEREGIYR